MKALPTVRPNKIRQAIAQGKKAVGFQMAFYCPYVIEIFGSLKYDYVYLDCEHGTFTLSEIENCCRAAEVSDLTVICRLPDIKTIKAHLDRGVQGLIIPHVSTRAVLEEIVEETFYKPRGSRANAGGRGDRYWYPVTDFDKHFKEANDNISLAIQIEDTEAMRNLDDILAYGNVDYYIVGKNDLAQSLGVPRKKGAMVPQLDEAVRQIRDKVHKIGGHMSDDVLRQIYMREHLFKSAQFFLDSDAVDSYALKF